MQRAAYSVDGPGSLLGRAAGVWGGPLATERRVGHLLARGGTRQLRGLRGENSWRAGVLGWGRAAAWGGQLHSAGQPLFPLH